MVRGLVPSMSYMSASYSDVAVGLVPTWSDIRAISILWMEVPSQFPWILVLGLRAILIWLWDVVLHDQMWVHGHSDVIEGCVPTWSDTRVVGILWMEVPSQLPGNLSLGMRAILIWLWDVFSHDQIWVHGHSNVIEGCVPTLSNIRVVAILSWWEDCFLPCQMWVPTILT